MEQPPNAWRPAHIHFSVFGRRSPSGWSPRCTSPTTRCSSRPDPQLGARRAGPARGWSPRYDHDVTEPSSGRSATASTSCCAAATQTPFGRRADDDVEPLGRRRRRRSARSSRLGLTWPARPRRRGSDRTTPGASASRGRLLDGAGAPVADGARRDLAGQRARPVSTTRSTAGPRRSIRRSAASAAAPPTPTAPFGSTPSSPARSRRRRRAAGAAPRRLGVRPRHARPAGHADVLRRRAPTPNGADPLLDSAAGATARSPTLVAAGEPRGLSLGHPPPGRTTRPSSSTSDRCLDRRLSAIPSGRRPIAADVDRDRRLAPGCCEPRPRWRAPAAAVGCHPTAAADAIAAACRRARVDMAALGAAGRRRRQPGHPAGADCGTAAGRCRTERGRFVHAAPPARTSSTRRRCSSPARVGTGSSTPSVGQPMHVRRWHAASGHHHDRPDAGPAGAPHAFGAAPPAGAPASTGGARLARTGPIAVQLGGAAGNLAGWTGTALPYARFAGELRPRRRQPGTPNAPDRRARRLAGMVAAAWKDGQDMILLAQTEVGELRESGSGGSSSMAHKHNPVAAIRPGAAAQAPGLVATLLAAAGRAPARRRAVARRVAAPDGAAPGDRGRGGLGGRVAVRSAGRRRRDGPQPDAEPLRRRGWDRRTGRIPADGAAQRQVAGHRGGVDLQTGQRLGHPGRRAPGRLEQCGQGLPLGVPRSGTALQLGGHRGEQGDHQPGSLGGSRPSGDRGNGVVLVRHGRGTTAAGLAQLADLGLGQQHHVTGYLGQRAAGDAEPGGQRGDPAAFGVPDAAGVGERAARRRRPRVRRVRPGASRPGCRSRHRAARQARPGSPAAGRPSRSSPSPQPAATAPNVVGRACCISVRPIMVVARWACVPAPHMHRLPHQGRRGSGPTQNGRRAWRRCRRCPGWWRRDGRRRPPSVPQRPAAVPAGRAPAGSPGCRRRQPAARGRPGRCGRAPRRRGRSCSAVARR